MRKSMRKPQTLSLVALLLVGCATTQPTYERPSYCDEGRLLDETEWVYCNYPGITDKPLIRPEVLRDIRHRYDNYVRVWLINHDHDGQREVHVTHRFDE